MRFDKKHILVTGASGGIGSQTALLFAGQGASVALHYYKGLSKGEKIREKILNIQGEAVRARHDVRIGS
jgi:3-oxoacyl-[acyl-carrier protein] reductase